MDEEQDELPVLTAVSSSARQLYLLLRCINFSDKAHVQINEEGLKFSVDEASSMEGSAFLDKKLFTTYTYHAPPPPEHPQNDSDSDSPSETTATSTPTFQISLPSLLETLQILTLTDPHSSKPPWAPSSTFFNPPVLGLQNLCRISYQSPGSPLSIILTESTIRTTCNLTTYEPDYNSQSEEMGMGMEIPFDRASLAFKTIMRGSWLSDAVQELGATSPECLTLIARMRGGRGTPSTGSTGYFALSASGPLGSACVEFNNNVNKNDTNRNHPISSSDAAPQTNLLETFQLSTPTTPLCTTYKFSAIQKAAKAMSIASKVSVRVDTQGVLSLQFMIEVESGSGKVSFVDFRFVPLVDGDEDDDGVGGGRGSGSQMEEEEEEEDEEEDEEEEEEEMLES